MSEVLQAMGIVVISLGLSSIVTSLDKICKEIEDVKSQINLQTAQQDWLVTHYAKPVRGIFPWDKNKCVYCGSETDEGDGPIVIWKVIKCSDSLAIVEDEKDKVVAQDMTTYFARLAAQKLAREQNKNVVFKFFMKDENGLLMEESND